MRSKIVWKNCGYTVMIDCKEEEETRKNAERLVNKINKDSFFDFYSNPNLSQDGIIDRLTNNYDKNIINVVVEENALLRIV